MAKDGSTFVFSKDQQIQSAKLGGAFSLLTADERKAYLAMVKEHGLLKGSKIKQWFDGLGHTEQEKQLIKRAEQAGLPAAEAGALVLIPEHTIIQLYGEMAKNIDFRPY